MHFKHWPLLADRSPNYTTGSTYTGLHTDPFDDEIRLVDFHEPGDTSSIRNYPKNWGSKQQAIDGGRSDPYVYPARENPLRTVGLGQDFSCVTLFPRRLLEQVDTNKRYWFDSLEYGHNRWAAVAADPRVNQTISDGAGGTQQVEREVDINIANSVWPHGIRIGYNLVMTYDHIGPVSPNVDSDTRNPYFLCKDGVVRQYRLDEDDALNQYCVDNFAGWSRRDVRFMKFNGTPPSEDLVSIASVAIRQTLYSGPLTDDDGNAYPTGGLNGWEPEAHANIVGGHTLSGHLLTTQMQVVPGSTREAPTGFQPMTGHQPPWCDWPAAFWDGDSGTPLVGMSKDGPWCCMVASLNANQVNYHTNKWWDCVNNALQNYSDAASHVPPGGSFTPIKYYFEWQETEPTTTAITGPIKPKRTETASTAPTAAQLEVGELAVNSTDKSIFTKKADGTVVTLVPAYSSTIQLLLACNTASLARTVLGVGIIGTRTSLNDSYTGFIEAPTSTKDYIIDAASAGAKTLINLKHKAASASGTVQLLRQASTTGTEQALTNAATIATTLTTTPPLNTAISSSDRLILRFSSSSSTDFEFTATVSVTS